MTMERSGVCCVGSVVVDLTKAVPEYPSPNRMTVIEQVVANTGGPGMNMAVNLRMLGAPFPVTLVGVVGDDENGAFVGSECHRLGVDDTGVVVADGVATSFTDVLVEPSGRRTMFHHPGSNDRLVPALIDTDTCSARIFHVGAPGIHAAMDEPLGGDPLDGNGWSEVLARAKAAGMHTNMELVDLRADRLVDLVRPCLVHLDSIVINELEAGALTGIDVAAPEADGAVDWDGLEAMARSLVQAGVARLAVVHFPAGCVAAAPDGRAWRQGSVRLPPGEFRSALGAGDAFASGVLFGLHQGWEVEECLRLAVATAAASARDLTTSAAIEPAETCLAWAGQLGHRPAGALPPPL